MALSFSAGVADGASSSAGVAFGLLVVFGLLVASSLGLSLSAFFLAVRR